MPVVQGRADARKNEKREPVERFTQASVEVRGANARRIHILLILLNQISEGNYGREGRLLSGRQREQCGVNINGRPSGG